MYQISDVTPVVLKQEDAKIVDFKFLPPRISDVPVIKQENLESLGCESFVKPQIKVETVENSIEIKTEDAKCNYETNHMNSESTAAMGGTGRVKNESADEGDNTFNLVIESVTSLNTAVTTVDHLLMKEEEVPQTPTFVKTEVEEISFHDDFSDSKSETAILPSIEINVDTIDESAAATSASGRPRRSCKRINYSESNDVGREANDQMLIPSPKKRGRKPELDIKNAKCRAKHRITTNHVKTRVDSLEPMTGVRGRHTKKDLEPDELVKELLDGEVLQPDQLELLEDLRSRMNLGDASTLSYSNGPKRHLCLVCAYKSHRLDNMVRHVRCHTGEKPFACPDCDYRCVDKSHLIIHQRVHTGEKPHKCNVCGFRTKHSSSLMLHQRRHTGEKPYICTVCNSKFVDSASLKLHMRTHTGEKPYACTQCDFKSATHSGLTCHTKTHLGEKQYKCRFCDYKSLRLYSLQMHLKTHTNRGEKPYSCTFCKYRCFTKARLRDHNRVHTGEKPYSCTFCEYRSAIKVQLLRHIRVHTGEKPYVCDVCGFKSVDKVGLRAHSRIHSTDKPFCCFYCDYKTNRRWSLIPHIRRHTATKSYACPYCSYKSLNSCNLKRHIAEVHNGIKKYKCEAEGCDYRAVSNYRLNAHLKTHMNKRNRNKRIRISVVPQPPATTLTCYSCPFETPSRQKMKSHVLQHLVPVPPETNHVSVN